MTILQLVLILTAVLIAVRGDAKTSKLYNKLQANKVVGVASVASMTSRNGRVSSIGGIKFFTPDSAHYSNSLKYPLSVFTEKDGNFASGSVRFHPEGKGVSASATAGYIPPESSRRPTTYFMKPIPELFDYSKSLDPWFSKDDEFRKKVESWIPKDMFTFKHFSRPNFGMMRQGWMYPSFNPFVNFWR